MLKRYDNKCPECKSDDIELVAFSWLKFGIDTTLQCNDCEKEFTVLFNSGMRTDVLCK